MTDGMPDDLIARARIALQTECVDGAEWRAIVEGLLGLLTEPTDAMLDAGNEQRGTLENSTRSIYKAMVAAASAPAERKERT